MISIAVKLQFIPAPVILFLRKSYLICGGAAQQLTQPGSLTKHGFAVCLICRETHRSGHQAQGIHRQTVCQYQADEDKSLFQTAAQFGFGLYIREKG